MEKCLIVIVAKDALGIFMLFFNELIITFKPSLFMDRADLSAFKSRENSAKSMKNGNNSI